jgi:hypothetical protein
MVHLVLLRVDILLEEAMVVVLAMAQQILEAAADLQYKTDQGEAAAQV